MTETELTTRHWLNRAFYADKKAKALEMLVRQCRERAEGLSRCSEGNDKGRSDGAENGTENALMKLAEMERKADAQRIEAVNVSAEIQTIISGLHDDDLEAVLIHRYILFHTIEQTAEIMSYHPNTVKSKVKKAIQKLCTEMS
jgi:DNA-directed RNA polymerase specialized sigma24 family protein